MFNVARAALLNAGVSEAELPRTHRGVIEAFRIHGVQTGRIDSELASSLSRTESLRLKADYTSQRDITEDDERDQRDTGMDFDPER
jgi:uncharacterized protein (UPF0332 family)